jgi:hypothetical protein
VRVVREDLIYPLERVSPALSYRESVEQATCFVFRGGFVHAYDEKLYARAPLPEGLELEGAVHAKKLMPILKSLSCEHVEIHQEEDRLVIMKMGKKKWMERYRPVMDPNVKLPIDDIDEPKEWTPLHESFSDALAIVQECAGKDRDLYYTVCVHVHPERLEAIASTAGPAGRYRLKTGVRKACVVERDVIKHVIASGVEELGETAGWLHFRSGEFRMSCQRQVDKYPDLGDVFVKKGNKVILPASTTEVTERCEKFTEDDKENNLLLVELRPGWMRFHGGGAGGDGDAFKPCDYEGPPVAFQMSPKVLKGLSDKGGEAFVADDKLMIDGGRWQFVVGLVPAPEKAER